MENNEPSTEPTSMMNKKPEDLTVGEALKINLGAIAIVTAIPVVFYGGLAGYERLSVKFRNWRARRAEEKDQNEETEEQVSE